MFQAERKSTQKQITSERERADRMTQKIQDVNRQELETKKLLSQLEAAKVGITITMFSIIC